MLGLRRMFGSIAGRRTPRVSIVLPAFNCEKYLAEAIESVLAQTMVEFELLIIDDGSRDSTAEIVRTYAARDRRIEPVRFEVNHGLVAALNEGLSRARAELIARQDADDISYPERLERQLEVLESDASIGIVGTAARVVDELGNDCEPLDLEDCETDAQIRFRLLFNSAFVHPTVLIRRSALQAAGMSYDSRFPHAEDYDLWVRLLCHTKGRNVRQRLMTYRLQSGSVSHTYRDVQIQTANRVSQRALAAIGFNEPLTSTEQAQLLYIYQEAMRGNEQPLRDAPHSRLSTLSRISDLFSVDPRSRDARLDAFRAKLQARIGPALAVDGAIRADPAA